MPKAKYSLFIIHYSFKALAAKSRSTSGLHQDFTIPSRRLPAVPRAKRFPHRSLFLTTTPRLPLHNTPTVQHPGIQFAFLTQIPA